MDIGNLITPERVACYQQATSKKRALERLAGLLADVAPDVTGEEIFQHLLSRERLGSTGLGGGVAIPHGRVAGLKQPVGAFVRLEQPIDYDAIDDQPVDLLFALLVPEEATQEHLDILAQLAGLFSNRDFCRQLRGTCDTRQLYHLFHDPQHHAAHSA